MEKEEAVRVRRQQHADKTGTELLARSEEKCKLDTGR